MIFITGDTHGEVARFTYFNNAYHPAKDDFLIVAGDFGCVFGLGQKDEDKLDALERLPYTILFLDGNHECFPKLFSYPEELWNGGRVHRLRSNILHLMRGQVFTIEGKTIFTMGGGYSVDKIFRVPGRTWWPEELPSKEEYAEAQRDLDAHGRAVDVIVSHAAPDETVKLFLQMKLITFRPKEEMELDCFLEDVRRTVRHSHYYFGHLHMDRELWGDQTALYHDVYCLNTGKKL